MKFEGIREDAIWLLAQNRFENSKVFYEEHKNEIHEGVVMPMRHLAEDLFPVLEDINPDLILDPVRCLSRVRRDTRFSSDKTLYRENLWLMFRHQKNELPTPMFWFEFFPGQFCYGCGVISSTPAFCAYRRAALREDASAFLDALKPALEAGLQPDVEQYKRSKAAIDGIDNPDVAFWYDAKELFVSRHIEGTAQLNRPKALVKEVSDAYRAMGEFYRYCLALTTQFNTEGL